MKSKLMFLTMGIFLIFLLSPVSAITVYGDWEDGSQSIEIEKGQSVDFNVDFLSVSPPMTVNVKLYNSNDELIHVFENNKVVEKQGFAKTYTITESIYKNSGKFEVVLIGSDEFKSLDSYTLFLTIKDIPTEPLEIVSDPVRNVDENDNYLYDVETVGGAGGLTFELTEAPSFLSIDSNTGLISGIAPEVDEDTGFVVKVKVVDKEGSVARQSYILTVKNIPEPPQENESPIAQDQEVETEFETSVTIFLEASDPDGDDLTFSIVSDPINGVITEFNSETGRVVYQPNNDFSGSDFFKFKANDGIADSNIAIVSIIVKPEPAENNPPIITSDPVTKVDEDTEYVYDVEAFDPDGDALTFSLITAPNFLSIDSNTGLISGTTPEVDEDEFFSVSIKVSDGQDFAIQSYVLKVRNVEDDDNGDDNGDDDKDGKGGRRTGIGFRQIPTHPFDEFQYLSQFETTAPIVVEETVSAAEEKDTSLIILPLILLILIIIVLIITVLYLLR